MLCVTLLSACAAVSSPAGVHAGERLAALGHEGCDQCKQKCNASKANQLISMFSLLEIIPQQGLTGLLAGGPVATTSLSAQTLLP